jgi:MinD-like ATPase involved in chromosome partitioning or flagellar assembly
VYTITFYSFKGGVGRTLSLVNIGVELAQTGRKVLLVDFDLEAPGIDTFSELRAPENQLGLVDYITDYRENYAASDFVPDASRYVYETPLSRSEMQDCIQGKLWVMPAGKRDGNYAAMLAAIDWQRLYAEQQGFLLFEDLKAQWKERLAPDYVLIDSRTGHTEVGGICTRQLADAVVLLFFPNRQNLEGLKQVVAAIRQENSTRKEKEQIDMVFVPSNVPCLDDEEEILKGSMKEFIRDLRPKTPDDIVAIHRYESLHLVQQAIFTLKHRMSRLTKQYKCLQRRLVQKNVEDRLGAIDYLRRQLLVADKGLMIGLSVHDRVEAILEHHSQDSVVCFCAALLYKKLSLYERAIPWFEKGIAIARSSGNSIPPQALIDCAESRQRPKDIDRAKKDIFEALASSALAPHVIGRAMRILHDVDPSAIESAVRLPAFTQMDATAVVRLTSDLMTSQELLKASKSILFAWKDTHQPDGMYDLDWQNQLAITLIGLGDFGEAVQLFDSRTQSDGGQGINDVFNYAMASWGLTKQVPLTYLQKALELDRQTERNDANYEQCLALVSAVLGYSQEALKRIDNARRLIEKIPVPTFSCWRYLVVTNEEFQADLDALARSVETGSIVPEFLHNQR